ncbi:MAG: divalent-cation tolerance protein CutA [Thermoguttaceae bacterium]|nr:divalent-cation tolerance protein CutA [Thermoguttaceae bacterium]
MTAEFIQIQITYPTRSEAEAASHFLVDEGWAACAQLLGPIESRYVWAGKTENSEEFLLLAKTRAALFDAVTTAISERHSYDVPQIVGVPLAFVAPNYAAWLNAQIRR